MASNIPVIVQGNSFSLAIPLQIYYINGDQMDLQDYTPDPTDEVSVQLKGSRRNYTYTPTIDGNVANIDLTGNELADNYGVVVSVVKANGQRLRSFRTDQFFIVESSDDLTVDDIIEGLEENVIYLNAQPFIAGADGRGIESIVKTSTSGLVDTYTITYTDATTSTFDVTNGANGAQGAQGADGVGITSIEKTSTSGLVDTYTITLSNGETSTFEVTNGKDGVDLGLATIVNDLTTGGASDVLSAEMGKVLANTLQMVENAWTQTVKYNSMPARAENPIMLANETYKILIQADKPMGQTAWQLWIYTANGQANIQNFGSTDMSVQQTVTYTPTEDIYSIGCRYSQGVQDTSVMITYKIPNGTYRSLIDEVDDVLEFGLTTVLNVVDNPNQKYSQRRPFMLAGRRYKITVRADKVLTASQNWQLGGADYTSSQASRVFIHTFTNCDMSNGVSVDYTPAADIYTFYRWSQSGIDPDFTTDYKVEDYNESQRLHDIEHEIQSLGDIIIGSGVSRFDAYYRLGSGMIDTYNLITRPIGLIVMGQSNADGRIPNSSFPATATIDTTDDLALSKQLAHCLFMKGGQEGTYGEASKNFAARNNSGNWAFDDIVYNAVNQALGGSTDFYVIKQTRGATGIRLANGSFNANVNDFVKNGYAISQLYHFKLLIERALELNPNIDFKAILWHQGEAEWQVTEEGLYYECLCQIIYWLRGKVGNPKLPFIFGTVPTDSEQYSAVVKADMERVAQDINDCYLVDLGAAGDMIDAYHFGATTAERLAREMYKIMRQNYMLAPMITPI